MSALIFADDRPTSCDDDLYQWAMDAEAMIRNLHTENTALRVTEDNLRQELQECQDQRRAAFRRIEELDAMRAQIGQGEPVAWRWTNIKTERSGVYLEDPTIFGVRLDHPDYEWTPLYTHPAPQQKPLTDEQASVVQQEPVYLVKSSIGASVWVQVSQAEYDEAVYFGVIKRVLYTHPAPQQKPLLSSEILNNDAIMEMNADARLPFETIERFVRAIEAAHNIGEKQ